MEIKISAWNKHLGPDSPIDFGARISEEKFFADREDKIKVLRLYLGENTTIRIWPADPEKISALGKKLIEISKELDKL